MALQETILVLNNTVQALLSEATVTATVHLSDLPFRTGYALIFGLALTSSIASKTGNKMEESLKESQSGF